MGIRVTCPNGHKLNIKAFQAGKRGICPHCGASFLIPVDPSAAGLPVGAPPRPSGRPQSSLPQATESPQGDWYVHLREGGQFGPASDEIMAEWVAEGRVPADALLWREGWPRWKEASDVLPRLARPVSGATAPRPPEASGGAASSPEDAGSASPGVRIAVAHPTTTSRTRLGKPHSGPAQVVGFLVALVLILIVAFAWVITR